MSARRPPRLDERRESDFRRQLQERAQQWIPSWGAPDGERDFAHALLAVAARFSAEVAERLDQGAGKMALGLLDWLAVQGRAAVPARMPVVFKLGDKAAPVSAPAGVQLQVDAGGAQLVFETDSALRLVPSRLEMVVGADSGEDAYYLAPPGISSLAPLEPLPTQWQIRSFSAPGTRTLQLDPPLGFAPGMVIEVAGQQFRVEEVKEDLVTIKPPVSARGGGLDKDSGMVRKVTTFTPFDASAHNWQMHMLYLGHTDLLNIESTAAIRVDGLPALAAGVEWHYWGKGGDDDEPDWQQLTSDPSDATLLKKKKGAIEPRKVGEVESRWIRASIANVAAGQPALSDELTLSINPGGVLGPCSEEDGIAGVEAMANNTPLPLTRAFFPFGSEPRQFDTIYLGSSEAFSKHGASVRVCLDMADVTFTSLASLRTGQHANLMLAGVAQNGQLYLFSFSPSSKTLSLYAGRRGLSPPSPKVGGTAGDGLPVALDPRPAYRPAIWSRENTTNAHDAFVAVGARTSVWMWKENALFPAQGGWTPLGQVKQAIGPDSAVAGLVFLASAQQAGLVALLDGKLYSRNPDAGAGPWEPISVKKADDNTDITLLKIAPIVNVRGDMGAGDIANGLLGIGDDKILYRIAFKSPLVAIGTALLGDVDGTIAPAGLLRGDGHLLAVAVCDLASGMKQLRGYRNGPLPAQVSAELPDGGVIGHAIDVNIISGAIEFALVHKPKKGAYTIAWWSPFDSTMLNELKVSAIAPLLGEPTGAPTLLTQHIVVPGQSNQVMVAEFNLLGQKTLTAQIDSAVITQSSSTPFASDDVVVLKREDASTSDERAIVAKPIEHEGKHLYELRQDFGEPQHTSTLVAYRSSAPGRSGTATTPQKLKLATGDSSAHGELLRLANTDPPEYFRVTDIASNSVVTLDHGHGLPKNTPVEYWHPEDMLYGKVVAMMKLAQASREWDAALLERTQLRFPGLTPERQSGTAFSTDHENHPLVVALESPFTAPATVAGQSVNFVVDGTIDKWSGQSDNSPSNPELSWEYWNGTAWWKLDGLEDGTGNLKRSGAIRFTVPSDLQATDWSGKRNHWIRARLIGGDYGQPRTVVTTVPKTGGVTEQTVKRYTDDINAPRVLRLRVNYASVRAAAPAYVMTADSGTLRNQSDANRTAGALVTMFTHLADTLPQSRGAAPALDDAAQCMPDCASCAAPAAAPAPAAAQSAAGSTPLRALYLGFSAQLAGQPVNLLVLVDKEQRLGSFAPLRIEALCGEHFLPVVAEDTTRALGESGLLSLSLTLPTVVAGLFGRALCWLRLSPSRAVEGESWTPSLRGVYINAVWARAAETMTRERLGSSIGAPDQVLLLARPPLLRDTLQLRVREALSAEERDALLRDDPDSVVTDVAADLRGHWVRWRQVNDVDDSGPLERVYSLDETGGAVRFGDGLHGAIPPIGRDAIVAFSYQRTEPGPVAGLAPANMIAPRTSLNLITPVEGVEAVIAADQSAGGAPPDDAARVQRFAPARLRHRDRALTLRDLEDHALQSSPDVIQARAFSDSLGVRLVVAMRGSEVRPGESVQRELRRRLLAVAPPQLALGRALRIDGPALRRLRIGVELRIASLAGSGELAMHVKQSLAAFFDPAAGGLDQRGWRLGAGPVEDDVALALLDAPHLEGIVSVSFEEIAADGSASVWRRPVRRDELVMLADDALRIEFVIVETEQ